VSVALAWDTEVSDREFYLQHAQLGLASRDRWMRWARDWRAAGDREATGRCVQAARAQSRHVLECMRLADQELLP
jgi:hypothetical protein